MARRNGLGIAEINRYASTPSRPPSFGDEPEEDSITSVMSFVLVSITVFLAISFGAVHFGTNNIEANLEHRSAAMLRAAGFPDVDVRAQGRVVHLSGSIAKDQEEGSAFAMVSSLVGVSSVEGRLWPVFDGDLEAIEVTGDAIEITWENDSATVIGNIGSQDRRTFVENTLAGSFPRVDVDGLTVLEGLVEAPRWLGATLGLVISVVPSLPAGRVIVDPHNELLVLSGEVENLVLRNDLNARVHELGLELNFDVNPAIRLLEEGPTKEEIEELQVDLDELIEGKVVEFGVESYQLTERGAALLNEVLVALRKAPEVRIKIAGHTDSRGSATANQVLSEKRANTVFEYLVASGEASERFDVIGYGETEPTESNETEDGRARNRRIDFTALDGSL